MVRMMYEMFTHLLCVSWLQLDQLVIDSAMEKRVMEHQHAVIQQRVSDTWLGEIRVHMMHKSDVIGLSDRVIGYLNGM